MISERRLQNDCGMIEGDRQMHAHRGPPLDFHFDPKSRGPGIDQGVQSGFVHSQSPGFDRSQARQPPR
jgi:hypothetical protein